MKVWSKHAGRSQIRSAAFTLIEASMAALVVGIVFVSLYAGITVGTDFIASAREDLRATQVMEQKLEEIRLFTWSQVSSNGFVPPTFTAYFNPYATSSNNTVVYNGTISFTNSPLTTEGYNSNMMMIVVKVQWFAGKTLQTRYMNSLISQYGIQNYIY